MVCLCLKLGGRERERVESLEFRVESSKKFQFCLYFLCNLERCVFGDASFPLLLFPSSLRHPIDFLKLVAGKQKEDRA